MKTWREILERAGLTFLQSALAVYMGNLANLYSVDVAQAAATAGLASVVSLAYHLVNNEVVKRKDDPRQLP